MANIALTYSVAASVWLIVKRLHGHQTDGSMDFDRRQGAGMTKGCGIDTREASPPVVGAFDIGSNSIKMTVGRGGPGGSLEELAWASETVRLGTGVEATGRL